MSYHLPAANPPRIAFSTEHGVPSQFPQASLVPHKGYHFDGLHGIITSTPTEPTPPLKYVDTQENPSLVGRLPAEHAVNGINLPKASYNTKTVWR
jgi:hypothetical protein